jgi:hypothetical protein
VLEVEQTATGELADVELPLRCTVAPLLLL